jgi:hypothetical protein
MHGTIPASADHPRGEHSYRNLWWKCSFPWALALWHFVSVLNVSYGTAVLLVLDQDTPI